MLPPPCRNQGHLASPHLQNPPLPHRPPPAALSSHWGPAAPPAPAYMTDYYSGLMEVAENITPPQLRRLTAGGSDEGNDRGVSPVEGMTEPGGKRPCVGKVVQPSQAAAAGAHGGYGGSAGRLLSVISEAEAGQNTALPTSEGFSMLCQFR